MILARFERTEECPFSLGDLVITIDRSDRIKISGRHDAIYHIEGLTGDGLEYDLAFDESSKLLVVGETSNSIARVSLDSGDVESFSLNRKEKDDPDYYRQEFIKTALGCLFVYESGIVLFSDAFELMWAKNFDRYDWFFQKVENQEIIYQSEHEGVWRYDLATGTNK